MSNFAVLPSINGFRFPRAIISYADCIRRDRPRSNDKWHIDEIVITIRGKKLWLWRAIEADGNVLDILVQTRRNAKAAKRFFKRLVAQFGEPRGFCRNFYQWL